MHTPLLLANHNTIQQEEPAERIVAIGAVMMSFRNPFLAIKNEIKREEGKESITKK